MSGFLGQIIAGLSGEQGQSQIGTLLQQVLNQNGGGIGALMSRFQEAGLGEQAQSWVNTGPNQPVSPAQIDQVFSPEEIQGWASQAGVHPDQARMLLAHALPQAVDHATPQGNVPPAGATPNLSSLISKFFA